MAASIPREPWCKSMTRRELETWYNENIQYGTDDFDTDCRRAVDEVVRSVHIICSSNGVVFDVDKVVKGGSLGKGTMVKDLSDVDLVAFINPPDMEPIGTLPKVYKTQLKSVIEELEEALSGLPSVTINKSDEYLVNFSIQVTPGSRSLDVDLLPTAENFCGDNLVTVFREMLKQEGHYLGFYSASLVQIQWDFVGGQPGYVKALIRLVKYWVYKCAPKKVQKSYPLELITIYCWERAGGPVHFSKAQGLKDVLQVLTDLKGLKHYWVEHYDAGLAEKSITKLRHRKPIMLDPANPSNNACWVYQKDNNMALIQRAARSTLQCALLHDVIVYPNWSG